MNDTKNAPVNSTHLADEELQHFKKKLEEEQAASKRKINELKESFDDLTSTSDDTQSSQAHHQGDIASDETTKTTLMTSIEREQKKLEQITIALDRIETGNYGICIDTNKPIQKERLETIPYALRSVEAKR